MRLLCTPNSLYSRIVRIVAIELGIELPIEFVGVRSEATGLLQHNPTGKVPTLLLDDGRVLAESRSICEYLEMQTSTTLIAPVTDLAGREREGLVTGFIDGVAVWVRELRRAQADQSSDILALEQARAIRCLDYFEALAWPTQLRYAGISLACGLDLTPAMAAGGQHRSWQLGCPTLAVWYHQLNTQDAFRNTRPTNLSS